MAGEALTELIGETWKHFHLSTNPTKMELQAETIKVCMSQHPYDTV